MKRIAIIGACVLAVAVVGLLSVTTYDHYRAKRDTTARADAAEQARITRNEAQFSADVIRLKDYCLRQNAAYQALPVKQKALEAAPDCSLQIAN